MVLYHSFPLQLFEQPPPPEQQSRHLSAVVLTTATPSLWHVRRPSTESSIHSERRCTRAHRSSTVWPYHAGATSAALAACLSTSICMPGTSVAGWSDNRIHSRRHPTHYGQWSSSATFRHRHTTTSAIEALVLQAPACVTVYRRTCDERWTLHV